MAGLRVSTLAVGDEVLHGEVVNSNAAWLAEQCLLLGVTPTQHSVVGDCPHSIHTTAFRLLQQCDVLVITGGLGPTDDDLTIEALAQGWGASLVEDSAALRNLTHRFATLNKPMPLKNIKQALLPVGSLAFQNPIGTAPGMWWKPPGNSGIIVALPGVPKEMKALWPQVQRRLLHWLEQSGITTHPVAKRDLWFYGIGESHLMEWLGEHAKGSCPTVASYVSSDGRVRLRLTLHQSPFTKETALGVFNAFIEALPPELSLYRLDEPFTQPGPNAMHYLKARGLQLAIAESCTGGGLSHAFVQHAGASKLISTNIVTYSNHAKERMLHIPHQLIQTHGAVSEHVASAMAQQVRLLADEPDACVGLATTGIAGPSGGSPEKPVGTLCIGLAFPDGNTCTKTIQINSGWDRVSIQERFINSACLFLLNSLRLFDSSSGHRSSHEEPAQL